jgi:thiamine-monophosphate kinase
MKTVRDTGEFGLIRRLARALHARDKSVAVGIGDDCAVLRSADPEKFLLLTCDPVVEGIHFLRGTDPRRVGAKAMARNLSDIAAMGGVPRWAVISIGVRPDTPVRDVEKLYAGLREMARRFGCAIVGGDTTHVAREPFVVVTVVGEVERKRVALRSGARVGDVVFVTGKLGGSLRSGKHLTFMPRVREARWLVENFSVHAMMDVSDGLASDLERLVESSRVGFDICADAVPANGSLRAALCDGEDFELAFTVAARDAAALERKWKSKFNLRLTRIGRVVRRRAVLLDGVLLAAKGYDHFAKH